MVNDLPGTSTHSNGVNEFPQNKTINVRFSIQEIERLYKAGYKKPLEDVLRAWKCIEEADYLKDPDNSFFILGGYHGEPFAKRADGYYPSDKVYWGGFCNHGNVLFPTWHRAYLYKLEKAMQNFVPGVALPFFDETCPEALTNGLPEIFTQDTVELDGETILNPLKSFTLPEKVHDTGADGTASIQPPKYNKPKGYNTVRYPFSGLVNNDKQVELSQKYNDTFTCDQATQLLNKNYAAWMKGINEDPKNDDQGGPSPTDPNPTYNGIFHQYVNCLTAPNYTVFSNVTSATPWGKENDGYTFALEDPHNDVHLAIGSFSYDGATVGQEPIVNKKYNIGPNGDMGENNTAGLDPIFFFHHCNVDRMFWLWQKKNNCTDNLTVIDGYAGTSSSDSQGPTPDYGFDVKLDMDSPLQPFKSSTDPSNYMISKDVFNIETQLGYTYGPGSLDLCALASYGEIKTPNVTFTKKMRVYGFSRTKFDGSFVVYAWAVLSTGDKVPLGARSILSRWNVQQCANCQNHIEVDAIYPLPSKALTDYEAKGKLGCEVKSRALNPSTGVRELMSASGEEFQFQVLN